MTAPTWDTDHQVTSGLRFPPRFVGPFAGWTNGGVIAGSLASLLAPDRGPAVEVRIVRPVPLDTDLDVDVHDRRLTLRAGEEELATARVAADDPQARGPVPASAAADSVPVIDPATHPAPGCFACGPAHPDGLDLQPGAVGGRNEVATIWQPSADLAGPDGDLPPAVVWAAMDCPSWYAATWGEPALLGAIRGRQYLPLCPGDPVTVTAWAVGREGRKHHAGAALHTLGGDLVAAATSTWIYPKGP